MSADHLDDLLERMPAIAKAVNAFSSEAVQLAAFQALVGAHGAPNVIGPPGGRATDAGAPSTSPPRQPRKKSADSSSPARPAKRKSTASPTLVKDLNLRPVGKVSLRDFVAEKQPTDNMGRTVVAIYYLSHTLNLDEIQADHVFTCYREMGWKLPSGNFRNHLYVTASRKGWIDTSNMDRISLTAGGINHVEHDLPKAA